MQNFNVNPLGYFSVFTEPAKLNMESIGAKVSDIQLLKPIKFSRDLIFIGNWRNGLERWAKKTRPENRPCFCPVQLNNIEPELEVVEVGKQLFQLGFTAGDFHIARLDRIIQCDLLQHDVGQDCKDV